MQKKNRSVGEGSTLGTALLIAFLIVTFIVIVYLVAIG